MSLATRCPTCRTIFRLSIAEAAAQSGLVECGICGETFHSLDALVSTAEIARLSDTARAEEAAAAANEAVAIDEVAVTEAQTAAAEDERETASPTDLAAALPTEAGAIDEPSPAAYVAEAIADPTAATAAETSADTIANISDDAIATTNKNTDISAEQDIAHAEGTELLEIGPPSLVADLPVANVETAANEALRVEDAGDVPQAEAPPADPLIVAPTFLTYRPESSFRKLLRSRNRALFAALSAVALLLLAGQAAYAFRDEIAAYWPWSAPALRQLCMQFGCRVERPMRLDRITIEGSDLRELPEVENGYRFSALLRNHAAIAVRPPAIELTLTDTLDKSIVRRVLTPAQYLPGARAAAIAGGLAAGSELPVELAFQVAGEKIAGYRVGLFYP